MAKFVRIFVLLILTRSNQLNETPGYQQKKFYCLIYCATGLYRLQKIANQQMRCLKYLSESTAADPNFDLGVYKATEYGDELYLPVDISTLFHGYTDKISYKPGEVVSLSYPA